MTRLERLARLRFLCMASELSADPCTPERAARACRADRIAAAYRAERRAQKPGEPCGVCCKVSANPASGLCEECETSYDQHLAAQYAHQYHGGAI